MRLFLTTTGTQTPVTIADLGSRSFTHPTVDFEITIEFAPEEIARSADFQAAIDSGYITVEDEDGNPIDDVSQFAGGDMTTTVYDPDKDGIVDAANNLNDGTSGGGNNVSASEARTHIDDLNNPHATTADQVPTNTSGESVQDALDNVTGVSHTQNTDTKLDDGGPNEITAAEIRGHVDDTNNPHNVQADQVPTNTSGENVQDFIDSKAQTNGLASLDSGGKVPITQLPDSVLGQVIYKGTWDASTNTPTLGNGGTGGVMGDYYVVSVAGTTSIDGISDWEIGDWIINNGVVWEKVDNSDKVSSVNGKTGAVTLNSDEIPEATTNLYMTAAEKTKLAGIEDFAKDDQDASEVPTSTSGVSVQDHIDDSNNPHNVTASQVPTDTSGESVQDALDNITSSPYDNLHIFTFTGPDTTTSETFQNVINENPTLEAGDYIIEVSYGWNHNSTSSDFEGRVTFNGSILGDPFSNGVTHKQEPKDSAGSGGSSGTSQQYSWSQKFYVTGVTAGAKNILLDYRTDDSDDESTIWNVIIEIKRKI